MVDATVLKRVYSFLLLKDPRNSQIKLGKDNKVPNEKITVEKKPGFTAPLTRFLFYDYITSLSSITILITESFSFVRLTETFKLP